jgi:hypothetical protein
MNLNLDIIIYLFGFLKIFFIFSIKFPKIFFLSFEGAEEEPGLGKGVGESLGLEEIEGDGLALSLGITDSEVEGEIFSTTALFELLFFLHAQFFVGIDATDVIVYDELGLVPQEAINTELETSNTSII